MNDPLRKSYSRPATTMPALSPRKRCDHIPVRSVVYRKQVSQQKLEPLQTTNQFNATQSTFESPQHLGDTRSMSMTHYQSDKGFRTTSNFTQFMTTHHKLSMGRKTTNNFSVQSEKKQMSSTAYARPFRQHRGTKSSLNDEPPNDNMTTAAFIEQLQHSRPMTRQFPDEVFEHYNSEEVVNKPDRFDKFDQFSNPKRYGKKYLFKNDISIPREDEIREDNRLQFPQIIAEQENDKTLAAHFLGVTTHNIKHVELSIANVKGEIEQYKHQKEVLREEMEAMRKKHEQELRDIFDKYMEDIRSYGEKVKDDFIINQNDNFKLQKEITTLERDKMKIEKDIYQHLNKMMVVERDLYGFQLYDLQTEDQGLETMSTQNLRSTLQSSTSNRKLLH